MPENFNDGIVIKQEDGIIIKQEEIKPNVSSNKRAFPPSDWRFGYDEKGESKTRLIITLKNEKTGELHVKEYDKNSEKSYYCVGCLLNRRIKNNGEFDGDIFYAPTFHDCKKISAEEYAAEQLAREKKFMDLQRKGAASTIPFSNGKTSKMANKKLSTAASPIIDVSDSPVKAKPSAQKKLISSSSNINSRSSSPIFITSFPRRNVRESLQESSSRLSSGKSKISEFFSTNRSQTPNESAPLKSQTAETPKNLKHSSKNYSAEKEKSKNTLGKSKSRNLKRTSLESGVTMIEATDEPEEEKIPDYEFTDFDDHPASFDIPQPPSSAAVDVRKEIPVNPEVPKQPSESVQNKEHVEGVLTNSRSKMQLTETTLLDTDIVLIQPKDTTDVPDNVEQAPEITVSPSENSVSPDLPGSSNHSVTPTPKKFTSSEINAMEKRKLTLGEFEYGVDGRNKPEGRIMVPDADNENNIRIYHKVANSRKWFCRGCDKKSSKKIYGILNFDVFAAPPQHHCSPLTREEWYEDQQSIKDKYSNVTLDSTAAKKNLNSEVAPESSSNIDVEKEVVNQRPRRSKTNYELAPVNNSSTSSTSFSSSSTSPEAVEDFREVDTCYAQYGCNENGKLKGRLIVREHEPHRYLARQYAVTEAKEWKCLKCEIGTAKKNENGNFLVSVKHDCEPIPYSIINESQKVFEAKNKELKELSTVNNQSRSESQLSKTSFNKSAQQESNGKSLSSSTSVPQAASASTSNRLQESTSIPSSTSPVQASSTSTSSSTLQTITSDQWEWGCDANGKEKMRIIIFFDPADKTQVHEYPSRDKKNLCLGCLRKGKYIYAEKSPGNEPIISIPPLEEHVCEPRSIQKVRESQNQYLKNRRKRCRNYDREDGDSEPKEFISKKRTRRSGTVFENDSETTTSPIDDDDYEPSDLENDSNNDFDIPEPLQSVQHTVTADTVTEDKMDSVQDTVIDEKMDDAEDEPMKEVLPEKPSVKTIQTYAFSNHSTTVNFFNPSANRILKCCEKLQLPYPNGAYKFWGTQIEIHQISPKSIPNEIYSIKNVERPGFACISLFLTGTEDHALTIQLNFTKNYFSRNLAEIGKYYGEDFSRTYDAKTIEIQFSDVLTKYHLQAFCSLLECRIGIFVNNSWERYGNWDDEVKNVFTLLMKKEDEKFSPILSLL